MPWHRCRRTGNKCPPWPEMFLTRGTSHIWLTERWARVSPCPATQGSTKSKRIVKITSFSDEETEVRKDERLGWTVTRQRGWDLFLCTRGPATSSLLPAPHTSLVGLFILAYVQTVPSWPSSDNPVAQPVLENTWWTKIINLEIQMFSQNLLLKEWKTQQKKTPRSNFLKITQLIWPRDGRFLTSLVIYCLLPSPMKVLASLPPAKAHTKYIKFALCGSQHHLFPFHTPGGDCWMNKQTTSFVSRWLEIQNTFSKGSDVIRGFGFPRPAHKAKLIYHTTERLYIFRRK